MARVAHPLRAESSHLSRDRFHQRKARDAAMALATRDSLAHRAAGERSPMKTIVASTSAGMAPCPIRTSALGLREARPSPRPDGVPGRGLRPLARRGRASMVASGRALPGVDDSKFKADRTNIKNTPGNSHLSGEELRRGFPNSFHTGARCTSPKSQNPRPPRRFAKAL